MSRIQNLYELHKNRTAVISQDAKILEIQYELRSKPFGLKNHRQAYDARKNPSYSRNLGIKIDGEVQDRFYIIRITQKESDLNKLYDIFIVITYLLAKNITLYYYANNFPYYAIPREFNFGGYDFDFVLRQKLMIDPRESIKRGYTLLKNKESYFSKMVPYLLEVNTIGAIDMRFFAEYSLLEYLSSRIQVKGNIFPDKSGAEYKDLSKYSQEINTLLSKKYPKIAQNRGLTNKLKVANLNQKSVSIDRISEFISSFTTDRNKENLKYVKDWAILRNYKGVAHGNGLGRDESLSAVDIDLMEKLHKFLGDIVRDEYKIS